MAHPSKLIDRAKSGYSIRQHADGTYQVFRGRATPTTAPTYTSRDLTRAREWIASQVSTPIPRNRTRAQRAATGAVAIEVQLSPRQRDGIDAEARSLGLSRSATVAKWAGKLAKKHGVE